MEKRRVVITGMGAITPIGNTVTELWNGILQSINGVDLITAYDTAEHKVKIAAEVKNADFDVLLSPKERRSMDRYAMFALIAARQAYEDSGLKNTEFDRNRFGVMVSSGIGGLGTIETEHKKALERGFDRISPYFIPKVIVNLAAGNIAIEVQAYGMCSCVVTACASSSNAIGDAYRSIKDGYHDVMLAGGAEASITPLGMSGFTSMKALCESTDINRASIPFDQDRSGFVMGEGAGVMILEEYEQAKKRNAKIYGEIIGYGATCDAYHITSPSPDGSGAARSMRQAIEDAGLVPDDIGYINAHGTSTPLNDKFETMAVKAVFGEHTKVPVSSTKSMTGHLLGASGVIEGIISVLAIEHSFLPPTINLVNQDAACDLNVITSKGVTKKFDVALSNSLGFGGHNATLIFSKVRD